MTQNKPNHRELIVGLVFSVGLLIIFLSCNDGSFYKNICEDVISFLEFSDPKLPMSILDHPAVGHAIFYGLLTFLLLQLVTIPLSIISAISFGGLLEVAQMYLPTRFAHIDDFVADFIGIILAVLLYQLSRMLNTSVTDPDE